MSGTGFIINDEWVSSLLLAGLPEWFSSMIMAIEHSGVKITTNTIKTKLLDIVSTDDSEAEGSSTLVAKCRRKNKLVVDLMAKISKA